MKATRKDVARYAGVSTATVSNVLNHSKKVKQETIEKVTQAIAKLDYKPDMIAKSMSTNQSMQLGIVLESLSNPFFGDIVREFERAANEKNYFVNICTGFNNLEEYFDNFITRRVDGIFVAAIPNKFNMDKIYNLVDQGIKVVISGNVDADFRKVCSLESDHVKAMCDAMEYLYKLGHRRIAFLSGLGSNMKYDLRSVGYRKMVSDLDLGIGDSLLINGRPPYTTDAHDGYSSARGLLASGKSFTAVICTNDLMGIGAIRAFSEAGIKVPEDVSVIGFDGIELGKYLNPSLTTLTTDKVAFGKKAFELLYQNITKGNVSYYGEELKLIERESTAPCKSGRRS